MNISRQQRALFYFLLLLLSPASYSVADSVYKTIDDQGRVSYSATPADKHASEKIKLLPPPSADDIDTAKKRLATQQETGKMLEQARQNREQKLAEQNKLKQEKRVQVNNQREEEPRQQGPYYGIPGHGIIVLPKGPTINR
jgi:hypothetical protein